MSFNKEKSDYQKLKNIFDNKEFHFTRNDGTEFDGTIKEYFEESIMQYSKARMETAKSGLIHSTRLENAVSMVENGLDYSKNYRVQAGPGTYFAAFQDMSYGNIAVEGTYMGDKKKIPVFESQFYDAIMHNEDIQAIAQEFSTEDIAAYKNINKYCRDLMVNEMGIDVLFCAMGTESCWVVLNDETFDVQPYNFKYEHGDNGKINWKFA